MSIDTAALAARLVELAGHLSDMARALVSAAEEPETEPVVEPEPAPVVEPAPEPTPPTAPPLTPLLEQEPRIAWEGGVPVVLAAYGELTSFAVWYRIDDGEEITRNAQTTLEYASHRQPIAGFNGTRLRWRSRAANASGSVHEASGESAPPTPVTPSTRDEITPPPVVRESGPPVTSLSVTDPRAGTPVPRVGESFAEAVLEQAASDSGQITIFEDVIEELTYYVSLNPVATNNIISDSEASSSVDITITTDAPDGEPITFTLTGAISATLGAQAASGAATATIDAATVASLVDGDTFNVEASVGDATDDLDVTVELGAAATCTTIVDIDRSEASFVFNGGNLVDLEGGSEVPIALEWVGCNGSRAPDAPGGGVGLSVDVGSERFSSSSGLVNNYLYTVPNTTGSHTATFTWGNSNDPQLCSKTFTFTSVEAAGGGGGGGGGEAPESGVVDVIGHGTQSSFGNNGRTITVSNLNWAGAGSFRDAVLQSGARRVVFTVEGVLPVPSQIVISNGNLTIAGHTAPGKGFRLQATPQNNGMTLKISAPDILVENIGIYQHNAPSPGTNGANVSNRDALNVSTNSFRVCFSQCSIMWGSDETVSVWHSQPGNVGDVTFQYCLIAEGLSNVGHPSGEHSKGILCGKGLDKITLHHNWFTRNSRRNPRVQADNSQIINNVTISNNDARFRPMAIGNTISGQTMRYDVMYNLVEGNDGPEDGCVTYPEPSFKAGRPSVYGKGNIHSGSRSNDSMDEFAFFGTWGGGAPYITERTTPHFGSSNGIVTHTSAEGAALRAYVKGLVGMHNWNRHPNDQRVLDIEADTVSGTNTAIQLY